MRDRFYILFTYVVIYKTYSFQVLGDDEEAQKEYEVLRAFVEAENNSKILLYSSVVIHYILCNE